LTKKISVIAGPNGACKTTFAPSFLPQEAQCPRSINAELIAAGLSPFASEAAANKSAVDIWAAFDNVGEKPTLLRWGEKQ
jgi:predicted ABC-type ATPase